MLKAIIFDMDDTLIDWEPCERDWFDSDRKHLLNVFNYVCQAYRPLPDFDAFVALAQDMTVQTWLEGGRTLSAPNLGAVLRDVLIRFGIPAGAIDIQACLTAYDWTGLPGVRPFPDILDWVPRLRALNLQTGLITNAYYPMWMRDREMTLMGLPPDWFDVRISSADLGFLKPHPAIFRQMLAGLGVSRDEAVFIGDSPEADIAGAQGVGMKAVLRVGNETPPMISGLLVPDAAINSLHELPPVLDRWFPGWRGALSSRPVP